MNLMQPPPTGEWYMDSGASNHVTSDVGNLSSSHHTALYTPSSIVVGNGATLSVTLTGSATLNFARPLHLNNVLVSPNMIQILFLFIVSQLTIPFRLSLTRLVFP
jgi:hypothetical protein